MKKLIAGKLGYESISLLTNELSIEQLKSPAFLNNTWITATIAGNCDSFYLTLKECSLVVDEPNKSKIITMLSKFEADMQQLNEHLKNDKS